MSRGLSSAEAALKRSANAETIDVKRMVCGLVWCGVLKMVPKFQWFVFTVKRPELLVTNESGYRGGVPAGCRGPLNYLSSDNELQLRSNQMKSERTINGEVETVVAPFSIMLLRLKYV